MSDRVGLLIKVTRTEVHYVPMRGTDYDKARVQAGAAVMEDEERFLSYDDSSLSTEVITEYTEEELAQEEDVLEEEI